MSLSIIAALGQNNEIGIENKLPWEIPEDMKRFRDTTRGHSVIMGRKTFESIGRLLPNRKNVIITKNHNFSAPEGAIVVSSLEDAIKASVDDGEVFIIGGSQIYKEALPYVSKMYLTHISREFDADTFFPDFNHDEWKISENSTGHRTEGEPAIDYSFVTYERLIK
ncbi:dihydrofolate reductase DfrA [soil metagenome]